ncbi:MAG: NusG domain II-containing protein, partial [Clostridiales bacterium]|nr:NusG domain II-containing protein [Clostridiales bacterium]
MKKKEVIFIVAILLLAFALWGGMFLMRSGNYASIRITVDGEEYGTYSLAKDQVISIGKTN